MEEEDVRESIGGSVRALPGLYLKKDELLDDMLDLEKAIMNSPLKDVLPRVRVTAGMKLAQITIMMFFNEKRLGDVTGVDVEFLSEDHLHVKFLLTDNWMVTRCLDLSHITGGTA